MMKRSQHFFIFLHLLGARLWNSVSSQVVIRYVGNDMGVPIPDAFPNPDQSCASSGCAGATGYKVCTDCCECRCNTGTYWIASKKCIEDDQIAQGCKYTLGQDSYQYTVLPTTSEKLLAGEKVWYCPNGWDQCATLAKRCSVNRVTTFYENNGWKILWPKPEAVDFTTKANAGSSDSILWKGKACNVNKYDGLVLSMGITCSVTGIKDPVNSCVAFKVSGNYKIGVNPLTRENCSTTTTSPPTTSTETKTKATKTTAAATATTTTATTGSASSTPITTSKTPQAISTKESTMMSSRSSSTEVSTPSTKRPSSQKTETKNQTKANATTPTIFPTDSNELTTAGKGIKDKRAAESESKKVVIAAASLSSAALLLIVFVAIAIFSFIKRRRHTASGHPDQRLENLKGAIISDPLPLSCAAGLPIGTDDEPSSKFWTIDDNGEFVLAKRPPVYKVCVKDGRSSEELEDGVYDQPIARKRSSLAKLYAVVNKKKKKSKKESDDLYSSIEEIVISSPEGAAAFSESSATKELPKNSSEGTAAHKGSFLERTSQNDIVDSQRGVISEPIYDEPENGMPNTESIKDEPIYMLYEPLPDRREPEQ